MGLKNYQNLTDLAIFEFIAFTFNFINISLFVKQFYY